MGKTIETATKQNMPKSFFQDVKYRATAGNTFRILTSNSGIIHPSIRLGGKHICEIIVYRSDIGLPGKGRQKLRLRPDAFGIRAFNGLYEKDIVLFHTSDRKEYVGEVSLGFDGAWYIKTLDDIFRLDEISYYRCIGTTLTKKTLQEYVSDFAQENVHKNTSSNEAASSSSSASASLTAKPSLHYVVYADGSAVGSNPGPAGFGYLIVSDEKMIRESSKSIGIHTNNAAEYLGIICGIKDALKDSPASITVYTDSKYIVDSINSWANGWEKNSWKKKDGCPVKNIDYLKELLSLVRCHNITLRHVKGHNGNRFNERCDYLANSAAKRNRS